MTTPADVLKMIKDKEVKFIDLRFTDTRGKEQHVSVPSKAFDADKFESGHAFDGSSIAGWKGIQASDMLLMPDPNTANIDPFMDETTLLLTCDVIEPSDGKGYERDRRAIAQRRGQDQQPLVCRVGLEIGRIDGQPGDVAQRPDDAAQLLAHARE